MVVDASGTRAVFVRQRVSTPAAPPFLDVFVYQYAHCVQPSYHQADLLVQDGTGRYQIDVKGEACTVELQERMGFSP